MIYEKVKYILKNNDTGEVIDTSKNTEYDVDPKNAENSERTLKRTLKTAGVFTEFSKNLVFTKGIAEFLTEAYESKDIEADVSMDEYRYNPETEIPFLYSPSVFDFSDFEDNKTEVKVPFKTSGLNAKIKAQLSEKFELDRTEALNGNALSELKTVDVALTSRDIYLVSKFKNEDLEKTSKASVETNDGNTRTQTTSIPLELYSQSHENAQYVFENTTGSENVGSSTMMFFLDSDKERLLNIDLTTAFDVYFQQYEHVQWCRYQVCLTTYENGNSFDLKERVVLAELRSSGRDESDNLIEGGYSSDELPRDYPFPYPQFTTQISAAFKGQKTVLAGESLALEIRLRSDMSVSNTAGVRAYAQNIESELLVTEDSFNEDSKTKAVRLFDIGDRLMQIITGEEGRFKSDLLTKDYPELSATTGFWIRQFYDESMIYSLSDFFSTLDTILNTGYSIEIIDGVETLVLESKKYFFQNEVAIILDEEVTNYERKVEKDLCNSSLEFGYKEGGEYDEAMGLDEYNVKSSFTLPITRVDTTYQKESPTRADSYGKEFARRKQQLDHPEEDTSYDSDNFLLDLKIGDGDALEERTWSDDFEELPTGIYSPETATGLRFTPSQIEKRHQWVYGSGIYAHQSSKVYFSSGTGNSELVLKPIGEESRTERDNLNINELERPVFLNKKIVFEHPVTHDINNMIYGKTDVDGRLIPNYFFKVAYKYRGKTNYGYLKEYKKKDAKTGTFTLIKAL